MQRIPDVDVDLMAPRQRQVHDAIVNGPRGVVQGPLRIWLNSPELAQRSQELGAFCRYGSSLDARLSELAIITIGAHWHAGFEWYVHAPIAEDAGIDAAAINAIKRQAEPRFAREDERVVYHFTRSLIIERAVSQETFNAALMALGTRSIVDLVGIIGYYSYIAMTIVAFQVETPGGDPFNIGNFSDVGTR